VAKEASLGSPLCRLLPKPRIGKIRYFKRQICAKLFDDKINLNRTLQKKRNKLKRIPRIENCERQNKIEPNASKEEKQVEENTQNRKLKTTK
jgi:hypothetical protein